MHIPRFSALGVLLAVPTLFSIQGTAIAQPAPTVRLESAPFTAQKQTIEADRGWLTVPENRSNAASRSIELAFVRFKSTAAVPGPPLVFLVGGPGGSGIGTARSGRFHLLAALREVGDVIVLDQRGTGISKPNLESKRRLSLPLDKPGDPGLWIDPIRAASAECAKYWKDQGVDLAGYTTAESADDVDALRAALGYEKINLWGTSYGTHLSFSVLRRHGQHVNRVIVSGVEGPDHTLKSPAYIQRQLETVAGLIRNDPQWGKEFPDFVQTVRDALERLEREPMTVAVGSGDPVTVGKFDLQLVTSEMIGRVRSLRGLPKMYRDLAHGDARGLAAFARGYRTVEVGNAMSWAMDCASGISEERRVRYEREAAETLLGAAINFPYMDVCPSWGVPSLGPEFREDLESEVPVLFISGTLDGRTPPENVEELRGGFPNGEHLIVENAGHDEELFSFAPGLRECFLGFLKGEPLPTTRIVLPPVEFTPPKPD